MIRKQEMAGEARLFFLNPPELTLKPLEQICCLGKVFFWSITQLLSHFPQAFI